MADRLALIDYGAGNLHSVANALAAAGADHVAITADPDVVRSADRIVLPGVGSFRACAEGLRAIPGLVEAMDARVRGDGVPFLGICVGMQLLATRGVEHGITRGLGWIPGEVRLIAPEDPAIKVPHMGWNDVVV
ncbi:MAG TPA: imidazole glycerol phosphate synthase subunit HisH, partial [Novosphingobium sp.]|nr:imidazole glycerol phosphate synthase subunit HisH [Novosphingobium sp.]